MFWPVARKIPPPPPTRLGLTLSLACFASLKSSGFEFDSLVADTGPASLGPACSKDDDPPTVEAALRNQVDTGSKVSGWEMGLVEISTGLDSTRGVVGAIGKRSSGSLAEALPKGSTILIGTRGRFVAAVRS